MEGQEPVQDPINTTTEETAPDDNEKTDVGSTEEPKQPDAVTDESSDLPREGDVPVESAETEPGSNTQILSRKMEVPNDKVNQLSNLMSVVPCIVWTVIYSLLPMFRHFSGYVFRVTISASVFYFLDRRNLSQNIGNYEGQFKTLETTIGNAGVFYLSQWIVNVLEPWYI